MTHFEGGEVNAFGPNWSLDELGMEPGRRRLADG